MKKRGRGYAARLQKEFNLRKMKEKVEKIKGGCMLKLPVSLLLHPCIRNKICLYIYTVIVNWLQMNHAPLMTQGRCDLLA